VPVTTGLALVRRRARRFTIILLPALLLRSLIPFGFMPMADARGVSIVLCRGEGAMPAGMAAAHSQHMHHSGQHDGAHSGHEAPCLFAASASPAFASTLPALPASVSEATPCPLPDAAGSVMLPSIRRAQSPRGPPPTP
jgi:hypothetical protein